MKYGFKQYVQSLIKNDGKPSRKIKKWYKNATRLISKDTTIGFDILPHYNGGINTTSAYFIYAASHPIVVQGEWNTEVDEIEYKKCPIIEPSGYRDR